jgi:general secretion pathway protein M
VTIVIDALARRPSKRTLFCAFNAFVGLFIAFFVVEPLMVHFSSQSDAIAEREAQLTHFQAIARKARALKHSAPGAADPFLSGTEERVVSADLQANLKSIVATSGVRFLSVRGLQGSRRQQTKMVAVGLELEGTLAGVRDVIEVVENQTPFLFVTSAVLRSSSEPNDNLVRVELTIEGAMRDQG